MTMANDPDEDRIRRKAHELWEADGRPHGRDQDHWVQAREIIAIEDSAGATLLPRDTGVDEPIEDADEALRNLADFPNLTDQGENLLTSTDREPTFGGGSSEMPSVEIPTSDQPGIPQKPQRAGSKPDADMKASPKNDAPPPGKVAGAGKAAAPKPAPAPTAKAAPPPRPAKPAGSPKKS
jgi:Protein of unknown function (DUF2934)